MTSAEPLVGIFSVPAMESVFRSGAHASDQPAVSGGHLRDGFAADSRPAASTVSSSGVSSSYRSGAVGAKGCGYVLPAGRTCDPPAQTLLTSFRKNLATIDAAQTDRHRLAEIAGEQAGCTQNQDPL